MRGLEAYGINGEKKNTEGKRQKLSVALSDWMEQRLLKKKRIS
jgi:predicted XRE-type DNA-binding protein